MTAPQTQPETTAARPAGTHFFVLTLNRPGEVTVTQEGTCTPPPEATRQDMYRLLYDAVTSQNPDLSGAAVGFFSLEPNRL
ncbi:hypothetical protein ACIPWY_14810 [Streptomyces sp. NPDC090032]|uniref:hypothetical protein n=1 Tax=Streptomyces sp. NPDC090032 TaxID=3365925 RepID=UPI00382312B1